MKKRLMSAILAVAMILGIMPVSFALSSTDFVTVKNIAISAGTVTATVDTGANHSAGSTLVMLVVSDDDNTNILSGSGHPSNVGVSDDENTVVNTAGFTAGNFAYGTTTTGASQSNVVITSTVGQLANKTGTYHVFIWSLAPDGTDNLPVSEEAELANGALVTPFDFTYATGINGTVGTALTPIQVSGATGGTGFYKYSSADLADYGLSITADGEISGTPTKAATGAETVTISCIQLDADGGTETGSAKTANVDIDLAQGKPATTPPADLINKLVSTSVALTGAEVKNVAGVDITDKFTVTYEVTDEGTTGIAKGVASNVTALNVGTATITVHAVSTETANYANADDVTYTITFVNKTALTGTFDNLTKTYGSVTAPTYTPGAGQDAVTTELQYQEDSAGGWSTTMPTKAGTHKVKAVATGASATTYGESAEAIFTVDPKTLTVSDGDYAVTKVYDKTSTAGTATGDLAVVGKEGSDDVSLTGATVGTYADENVGTDKTVEISGLSLTGTAAGNYTVAATYSFTKATITAKPVTITTTAKKGYDSTDAVAAADLDKTAFTSTEVGDIVVGDTITVTEVIGAKYANPNLHTPAALAQQATSVTCTGAENYTVTLTITTGEIVERTLTLDKMGDVSMRTGSPIDVNTLLKVKEGTPALVNGDSIDSLFGTTLTFNENGAGTADNTWTCVKDGITTTVVFYDSTGATVLDATPSSVGTYQYTIAVSPATKPFKTNYDLAELTTTDKANLTLTKKSSGGGGGGGVSTYTVTYDAGKNGKITDGKSTESVESGKYPKSVPTITANEGYKFLGWSTDGKTVVKPTDTKITKSTTFTALYEESILNKEDHMAYIKGYENDTFRPGNNITRAEVAAIFSRIMKNETDVESTSTSSFSDVAASAWYAPYIVTMEREGLLKGYSDGTFRPNASITRAEFTAMATRVTGVSAAGELPFTDVSGQWALDNIYTAYKNGWINGYSDNTFRPEAKLTRAEAVKMVNAMLDRSITSESITDATYTTFTDVPSSYWAYYDIIEASNAHEYVKADGKEIWTK